MNNQPEITTLTAGDGVSKPQTGQTVTAHYHGTFLNGSVFDSSVQRNKPFQFKLGLGQVIKCWDFTVAQMTKGQKVRVKCPSATAYGSRGAGNVIPPNTDLMFEIELLGYQ